MPKQVSQSGRREAELTEVVRRVEEPRPGHVMRGMVSSQSQSQSRTNRRYRPQAELKVRYFLSAKTRSERFTYRFAIPEVQRPLWFVVEAMVS